MLYIEDVQKHHLLLGEKFPIYIDIYIFSEKGADMDKSANNALYKEIEDIEIPGKYAGMNVSNIQIFKNSKYSRPYLPSKFKVGGWIAVGDADNKEYKEKLKKQLFSLGIAQKKTKESVDELIEKIAYYQFKLCIDKELDEDEIKFKTELRCATFCEVIKKLAPCKIIICGTNAERNLTSEIFKKVSEEIWGDPKDYPPEKALENHMKEKGCSVDGFTKVHSESDLDLLQKLLNILGSAISDVHSVFEWIEYSEGSRKDYENDIKTQRAYYKENSEELGLDDIESKLEKDGVKKEFFEEHYDEMLDAQYDLLYVWDELETMLRRKNQSKHLKPFLGAFENVEKIKVITSFLAKKKLVIPCNKIKSFMDCIGWAWKKNYTNEQGISICIRKNRDILYKFLECILGLSNDNPESFRMTKEDLYGKPIIKKECVGNTLTTVYRHLVMSKSIANAITAERMENFFVEDENCQDFQSKDLWEDKVDSFWKPDEELRKQREFFSGCSWKNFMKT